MYVVQFSTGVEHVEERCFDGERFRDLVDDAFEGLFVGTPLRISCSFGVPVSVVEGHAPEAGVWGA